MTMTITMTIQLFQYYYYNYYYRSYKTITILPRSSKGYPEHFTWHPGQVVLVHWVSLITWHHHRDGCRLSLGQLGIFGQICVCIVYSTYI